MSGFDDADLLFEGRIDPDDAPRELRALATLVRTARADASVSELADEEAVVARMAMAIRAETASASVPLLQPQSRPRLRPRALSAKVTLVSAAVVLSGGVAAAATGSLPSGIQRSLSHGLLHVGISIPAPTTLPPVEHHAALAPAARNAGASPVATTTTGLPPVLANRHGQCTAYEHASTSRRSLAALRLAAEAAAEHESVAEYCAAANVSRPIAAVPITTTTSAPVVVQRGSSANTGHPSKKATHGSTSHGLNKPVTTHRSAAPPAKHGITSSTGTATTTSTTSPRHGNGKGHKGSSGSTSTSSAPNAATTATTQTPSHGGGGAKAPSSGKEGPPHA